MHEIPLKSIIADIENIYDPRIKSKEGVSIYFSFPNNSENIVLTTDGQRLKQVFVNLINNAIKFTEEGKITIGYALKENEIEFFVSDTGKGIEKQHQSKIFERFVKVQGNIEENTSGTGLGLPISKGIIEVLGGKIWVKSTIKIGTTFYFTIPLKKNLVSAKASMN